MSLSSSYQWWGSVLNPCSLGTGECSVLYNTMPELQRTIMWAISLAVEIQTIFEERTLIKLIHVLVITYNAAMNIGVTYIFF